MLRSRGLCLSRSSSPNMLIAFSSNQILRPPRQRIRYGQKFIIAPVLGLGHIMAISVKRAGEVARAYGGLFRDDLYQKDLHECLFPLYIYRSSPHGYVAGEGNRD
jgi:hypothetical protein